MEEILHKAERLEKDYDWHGAAESYEEALKLLPENDLSKKGETCERLGYDFFRAAMQADSVDEFKKHVQLSAESYEKAGELFEKVQPARSLYCKAMARYSDSWCVGTVARKRELLDDCWKLLKEAFASFKTSEDQMGCGKAFRSLSFSLRDRDDLEGIWHERKRIAEDAIKYGQETVYMLSEGLDANELAWAYVMTSYFMVLWIDFFDERRAEFVSTISSYLGEALKLSEKTEDLHLLFFMYHTLLVNSVFIKPDWSAAWGYLEKELHQSEKSRDHYLLGLGDSMVAGGLSYEAVTEEDPDRLKEKRKRVIEYGQKSVSHFLLVCQPGHAGNSHVDMLESYIHLAESETDRERKRVLLKQAVKVGLQGSEYANLSGSSWSMTTVFHALSKALFFLSETESDLSEKKKMLEEAANLREKTIELGNQLNRPGDWDNGVYQNYLALIKADLARIEEGGEKRRHLLEEAVQDMEKCLQICTKDLMEGHATPLRRNFAILGWYHDWFGQVLDQLYSLTKDEKVIRRSIQVHESAAKTYQKAGMPSRVAEAYWKAARLYDAQGEYTKAADSFDHASRDYDLVSKKIPQLKDFYHDHAVYMQAWSEIEKARHHHARQEYGSAEEHFEKAADLHKALKQWSYLAPNYSAWTQLEHAEELSRKEQDEEARESFEEAARLFDETKTSIQLQLDKIENADEKQMAINMLSATDARREYCEARIAVEEAKIFDKKGDHFSSSRKYGLAVEVFGRIGQKQESEQEKTELQFITLLSRAWQKMTLAEAEASPALYVEASEIFEQARDYALNEKTKMLVLGHSRFCKALEAGTKFADTREQALHALAVQHLASASNYYIKADFQNASEYAKATKLLFDAYLYMDNAEKESDLEKKAKLYVMIERVLQSSAGSYTKAEHPEKREQILRLVEKTKEEQELAASMTEALHSSSIVSATTSFASPTPTQEQAVGSERFEHADVQANLIIRQKELKIGENLSIELELVNAGKSSALLTKVIEIIPKGFEVAEKTENCRVEDSYLNLKGKRLDPLRTEEVKLALKPTQQGTFSLKPTVLYLDENGKYKSHELEPVTIVVKELGVRGWLKGER